MQKPRRGWIIDQITIFLNFYILFPIEVRSLCMCVLTWQIFLFSTKKNWCGISVNYMYISCESDMLFFFFNTVLWNIFRINHIFASVWLVAEQLFKKKNCIFCLFYHWTIYIHKLYEGRSKQLRNLTCHENDINLSKFIF